MTHQSNERHPVKACLICKGVKLYYLFSVSDHRIVRCDDCGLLFFNPQPSDDELSRIFWAATLKPDGRLSAKSNRPRRSFIFRKSAVTAVSKMAGCLKSAAETGIFLSPPKPKAGLSRALNIQQLLPTKPVVA
jgi:hypothetical protein